MRLAQKILAGVLFFIASPGLLVSLFIWFDSGTPRDEKTSAFLGGLLLGLPPAAAGSFLVWNLRRTNPNPVKNLELEREQHFLDLLQASEGRLTPIKVAAEMDMTIAEAKIYLDQKAKQLNATFDVSEEGGITYRFHV